MGGGDGVHLGISTCAVSEISNLNLVNWFARSSTFDCAPTWENFLAEDEWENLRSCTSSVIAYKNYPTMISNYFGYWTSKDHRSIAAIQKQFMSYQVTDPKILWCLCAEAANLCNHFFKNKESHYRFEWLVFPINAIKNSLKDVIEKCGF